MNFYLCWNFSKISKRIANMLEGSFKRPTMNRTSYSIVGCILWTSLVLAILVIAMHPRKYKPNVNHLKYLTSLPRRLLCKAPRQFFPLTTCGKNKEKKKLNQTYNYAVIWASKRKKNRVKSPEERNKYLYSATPPACFFIAVLEAIP